MGENLAARGSAWRSAVCLGVFLLLAWPLLAQSTAKENPKTDDLKDAVTTLEIFVTGGTNSAPVGNASVYLRWEQPRTWRHPKQMEFDLKTNLEGVTKVKDVPRKRIMIQVIKDGWKPFGQYYDLDKDQQKIEIKLEKPPRWY